MNDVIEALKSAVIILVGVLVAIIGWFAKRTSDRVDSLKETAITREELTTVLDRFESRQQLQHGENRDLLERIENKIDANEERASHTRHNTLNEVHAIAMKVAMLQGREGR